MRKLKLREPKRLAQDHRAMQDQSWPRALFQIMRIRGQTLPPKAYVRGNLGFISSGCASLVTVLSDVGKEVFRHTDTPLPRWAYEEGCLALLPWAALA